MICKACGGENPEGTIYCTLCGQALKAEEQNQEAQQEEASVLPEVSAEGVVTPVNPANLVSERPIRLRKSIPWAWVVLGLLVLAGIGAAAVALGLFKFAPSARRILYYQYNPTAQTSGVYEMPLTSNLGKLLIPFTDSAINQEANWQSQLFSPLEIYQLLAPDQKSLLVSTGMTLWLVALDGSEPQKITSQLSVLPPFRSTYSWSADNQSIAYSTGTELENIMIIVATTKGEKLHEIQKSVFPLWSPNGKMIAHTGNINAEGGDLMMYDPKTSKATRVPNQPTGVNLPFAWSPDSQKLIVFNLDSAGESMDLYVTDSAGLNWVRLTTTPGMYELQAIWSPNRQQILFNEYDSNNEYSALYLINPDGSGMRQLQSESKGFITDITWLPDGLSIVYSAVSLESQSNGELYSMDLATGTVKQLTQTTESELAPVWAP